MSDKFKPNRKLSDKDNHLENTSTDYITITEDKLRHYSKDLHDGIKSKLYPGTPLAFFIAISTTLLTASFKEAYGKSADFWESCFFISAIITFFWLLYSIFKYIKERKKGDIDYFIARVRGDDW